MRAGAITMAASESVDEQHHLNQNHSSSTPPLDKSNGTLTKTTTDALRSNNTDCTVPLSTRGQQQQQQVVLIHGICGGAWCWYKIKPLLEMSGYKVTCLDLKSSGIDPTEADSVITFDDYNQPLDLFMDSLPEDEKVVLVGHSAGGLSVTWATHKYPNKVQGCVYVAATMLELGFQTLEDLKIGVPDLSELGEIFDYSYTLRSDDNDNNGPPTTAIFKEEYLRKLVFPLSPLEDITLAVMLSRPGPLLALLTAKFNPNEVEAVSSPRVYIKTKQDELMKKWQQQAMVDKWKPMAVYDIDSDHSPFLSKPLLLFSLILKSVNLFAAASYNHKPPTA